MENINGKAIYTPKGAALEYGRIGCNFYTGCPHNCEYCYLKRGITGKTLGGTEVRLKKCFKNMENAIDIFCKEVDAHLEQCRRYGIFFSFTTDPLIEVTRGLTAFAIHYCIVNNIPVHVLTKDATFLGDDLFTSDLDHIADADRKYIHIGFTLTGRDDMEPNASTNAERIEAMRILHSQCFATFASIEPVIEWYDSRRVIRQSLDCCDHYKIGLRSGVKKDYYDPQECVEHIIGMVKDITNAGRTVYLKQSVRTMLGKVLYPGAIDCILKQTVDADGNPYKTQQQ